jgi:glucose-6-phosphate 1-dehydrogenase
MNKPPATILTILGVTGDLTAKKIIPALYNLLEKNQLAGNFHIVGFGRREFTQEAFKKYFEETLKLKIKKPKADLLKKLLGQLTYQHGFFDDPQAYTDLSHTLDKIQAGWDLTNRLFYLAVPPDLYEGIFKQVKAAGLSDEDSTREVRILVEKPFGSNLKTAEQLDELLGRLFTEDKIYRIDHYLAKEMVQNILSFRFYNDIFEKTWNKDFIEKIEIKLWETLGVEARGAFYDGVGALRDVGQNHLLQMIALMTMEYPLDLMPSSIHARRAEVLAKLKPLSADEIKEKTFRAQYNGYGQINGVAKDSKTETYFRIQAEIDNDRWRGVPFFLEGGKRLANQQKETIVTFKRSELTNRQNRIIFSIEPTEKISVEFWAKKPGLSNDLEKRTMDFVLRDVSERIQYVEEYEKLLLDAILGDQTLFVSTSEVKSMWKFIDPIVEAWQKDGVPLPSYDPDTDQAIVQATEKI